MSSASDFHLGRCLNAWRQIGAVLFHEFALNPESSTFGQSGGARVKESASHHEMKLQNTNNTLKVESALLSALLAFTGVNFYVNFMFCVFCDFYKVKVSQSHCFWVLAPSWTFPNWFRTHLEFFMKTCFLRFPGSFWRHFGKYFEEVPNENSFVWRETSSMIKNNVFKTWGLPPIFIWIDFQCLALLWRALFHEFALNPESSTFGQSGGARVKESASNETTKHKQYIESRKCIAFCAPGFYRGQFLC